MVVSRLRLLLIGQRDCHTPQRVQNLLGVFVTHRVFRGAIQQLMSNFFCLVHDRRKGHIIVVANVVKQPFQLHHQAGCIHFAAGGLLQLPGYTLHLGLGSMVPGLQLLTVKHLAQGNVHLVQQLCKEVLDLFHNGLLFFLGQVGIFRQPLGELLAALLRAGFTANKVKDRLADGIFFTLEPLYSLAAAAVNDQGKRIRLVYQIADNKL